MLIPLDDAIGIAFALLAALAAFGVTLVCVWLDRRDRRR